MPPPPTNAARRPCQQAFRDALAGVDLPVEVVTEYGERVDVERILAWLEGWDQPTLTALTAVIEACKGSSHGSAAGGA